MVLYDEVQTMLAANLHIRRYAVRSSHDYEDGSKFSFSGLFHTELNLKGPVQIVMAIIECWKRSFQKSIQYYYRPDHNIKWKPCSIIIQEATPANFEAIMKKHYYKCKLWIAKIHCRRGLWL